MTPLRLTPKQTLVLACIGQGMSYKIADGWAEMKETDSEDGRWVKWADLQTYFTQAELEDLRSGGPELYGGIQGSSLEREWWAFLDAIAAKIAALLPESS